MKKEIELVEEKTELQNGMDCLNNEKYEQALQHLEKALKAANNTQKGECYYSLCQFFCKLPETNPLFLKKILEDKSVLATKREKEIDNEKARKIVARKYLQKAANHEYPQGLIEYALNCSGLYGQNNLAFDYNNKNSPIALAWADLMSRNKDTRIKGLSKLLYAKYYLGEIAEKGEEESLVNSFGNYVIEAKKIYDENDLTDCYLKYFLAHLYVNPLLKNYKEGEYVARKEGYLLFKDVEENSEDPLLQTSAKQIIKLLETKYSKFIEE